MIDKQPVIEQHRAHGEDTGSTKVQVALLPARINSLTAHSRWSARGAVSSTTSRVATSRAIVP